MQWKQTFEKHPQRHTCQAQVVASSESYSTLMFEDIQKSLYSKISHKTRKNYVEP
jgi:hypothetical protein